eukprot:TRINITY_DN43926_c0_g1_i1.p1 TRINITY_DN43926_c0_g1~~TRINITY_DN43926_c0_g1_i1.p1  ORF type:complete len:574 (+),score=167.94 TRINITY_DN43926_c0_g1_i1:67-1722(+)
MAASVLASAVAWQHAWVNCSATACTLHDGAPAAGVRYSARMDFKDSIEQTGWSEMKVSSPRDPTGSRDREFAFAAGFVEAAITALRISQHYDNFDKATFGGDESIRKRAETFVTDNDKYVRSQVSQLSASDDWWKQLGHVWTQQDGMVAGYAHARAAQPDLPDLGLTQFLLLNALVDLSSIIHKPFADMGKWTAASAREYDRKTTHCSSIVKVTPDYSELYASHNTWTGFFTMLRVSKTYDLPFRRADGSSASWALFAGYFGILASQDDFFALGSGLLVQETTNSVYNQTLLNTITPSSVLTWARSVVANRVAVDGPTWAVAFKKENSGTINNQWMVVNYNLFTPHEELKPGTLTVLEQLPGLIVWADKTDTLTYGYWPSYNRAYFKQIRQLSGQADMEKKFGAYYSYSLYCRAEIFRRDQGTIRAGGAVGDAALEALMRYNDWQNDPFSINVNGTHTPDLSIAARDDLMPGGPSDPFGNTDAKYVTSRSFGPKDPITGQRQWLAFRGVAGPTHESQPVFAWTGPYADPKWGHSGHPTSFDFAWTAFNVSV